MASSINGANCVQSIPYNQIPSFDFPGNHINQVASSQDGAYKNCVSSSTCVGFSSLGYNVSNFSSPIANQAANFFVGNVAYGMHFVQVKNWTHSGPTLKSQLLVKSPANCAWLCTVTPGCVGAISDGANGCWPNSAYSQPVRNAAATVRNMLIPVGHGVCTNATIRAGKLSYVYLLLLL